MNSLNISIEYGYIFIICLKGTYRSLSRLKGKARAVYFRYARNGRGWSPPLHGSTSSSAAPSSSSRILRPPGSRIQSRGAEISSTRCARRLHLNPLRDKKYLFSISLSSVSLLIWNIFIRIVDFFALFEVKHMCLAILGWYRKFAIFLLNCCKKFGIDTEQNISLIGIKKN